VSVARGHEHPITTELRGAVELENVFLALAPRGGRVQAEHQLDAVAAQSRAERRAQRRGLARKHAGGAFDDYRFPTEPAYDLRELDAGGSAAEHEQPSRDRLHARRLTRSPHPLELAESRDRRHDRIRARGHDHVLRGRPYALDIDDPHPHETAGSAQQVDAVLGQPALLTGCRVPCRPVEASFGAPCLLERRARSLSEREPRFGRERASQRRESYRLR
jgi:hypothetical protein